MAQAKREAGLWAGAADVHAGHCSVPGPSDVVTRLHQTRAQNVMSTQGEREGYSGMTVTGHTAPRADRRGWN